MNTIQKIATGIVNFINDILVPLVFALAFAFFLYGVFRYFFLGAADPKNREEGKKFVLWAVIAFAVMISVWGIVRVLAGTFGFEGQSRPCLPTFKGEANCANGSSSGGYELPSDVFQSAEQERQLLEQQGR